MGLSNSSASKSFDKTSKSSQSNSAMTTRRSSFIANKEACTQFEPQTNLPQYNDLHNPNMDQCGFPLQKMLYLISDIVSVIQMFQAGNPDKKIRWDDVELELGFEKSDKLDFSGQYESIKPSEMMKRYGVRFQDGIIFSSQDLDVLKSYGEHNEYVTIA